jgi:hypothetical protein
MQNFGRIAPRDREVVSNRHCDDKIRSPDERSDIRDHAMPAPDIALMSFVKRFERELSPPCDFRWSGR